MNRKLELVINGDDFGYCDERNKGILECFKEGLVKDTSLLINGPGSPGAVSFTKIYNIPVGLHLNFTEGKPTSSSNIPSLLNNIGEFRGKFGFKEAVKHGEIDLKDVETETRAQLDWFIATIGQKPTHIDGHNHIHVIPSIAECLARIFKEYSINHVRIPFEPGNLKEKYPWIPTRQLDFVMEVVENTKQSKNFYFSNGITSTNHFLGLGIGGTYATCERIFHALQEIGEGTVELMVHPGYKQVTGGDDFSQSTDREFELAVLKSLQFRDMLNRLDASLVSWSDIK